jgi:hypothetical protein
MVEGWKVGETWSAALPCTSQVKRGAVVSVIESELIPKCLHECIPDCRGALRNGDAGGS